MKCKKVRRLLSLAAGGEFSEPGVALIKTHLAKCSACRREYEMLKLSLQRTKELLQEEMKEWEEEEWQKAVDRALKEKMVFFPSRLHPGKRWVYASLAALSALVLVVVLSVTVFKSGFLPLKSTAEKGYAPLSESIEPESRQDTVSMTLVSSETGLRIKWFFIKDIDLEVKE
ncbi:MAG: anti-sigma factor family protein [Candidatus Aminicenantales bacterium]